MNYNKIMKPSTKTFLTSLPLLLLTLSLTACSGEDLLGGSIATMSIGGLIALVLIIYAIIDLLKSSKSTANKIIWGLVIWCIPFIGAIIYLIVGRE